MATVDGHGAPAAFGNLTPEDLLARPGLVRRLVLAAMVVLVALPVLPLWAVGAWTAAYLGASVADILASRPSRRSRQRAALALPFVLSSLTALMALALINRGDGSVRFFAVALITLSSVNALLRFYNAPRMFLAALSPHLAVILWICGAAAARNLISQGPLQAFAPLAVVITYALVLIPARRTLADAWRRLEVAKIAAEQASQAKSDFLATMSHEIRTPLNGVLGMAQAMQSEELVPTQKERLKVIRRSGEALLSILNDVLDLSKIEEGQLSLEPVDFDMEHVTRGAMATFATAASKKGLAFEFAIAQPAKGTFRGDSVRLRQILYNLVSNAVKFTESGSINVSVSYAAGGLRVEVADSGAGMPKDRIEQLFEKFVQGDASTTRRFGGAGLGLSICRRLAELMGGSISASSVEGVGSLFVVSIPIERVAAPAALAAAGRPQPTEADGPIRILAAEDNAVNQMVLKTLLSQVGLEPTVVENGALALEAWKSGDWDVILMDIQMPVMDGVDATREIRAAETADRRPRTPIIAVTANAMTHQVSEYAAVGMDKVVAKPVDAARLFEAIEQVLQPTTKAAVAAA